jgi:DNA-damage-inducible protein D
MQSNNIIENTQHETFESIRQIEGVKEYWTARELGKILDYAEYRNFLPIIEQAGVETSLDFAVFQNHGYKGLYGGLDAQGIHKHKGLKKSQQILDHMGSTELAANLFRATQAEEKLKRENIQGKIQANQAHLEVGTKVRQTIKELGGTMPENLPVPDKSVRQLEREQKKLERTKDK